MLFPIFRVMVILEFAASRTTELSMKMSDALDPSFVAIVSFFVMTSPSLISVVSPSAVVFSTIPLLSERYATI